ncbi:type II toxin-antitoxin system VapC family toxin [Beijerinckia indica]|uniref:Ribonuclease VapC n=1 Tax=Beijerinckia indica subsp. indica (strain ATCC 9039 / DSM 1715 / NCIMB 8712) TaxID=395963 RepID=B2ILC0_BEII9|nr:type II toxin-antitoxin system VapC family toxin [Beijerinckia indica]ACB97320.1 PilT protein domain protein [Beijerinckia indica subsp. indica ATCC 9039]
MVFVVDASIAAAWFLPDEQSEASDQVMAALGKEAGCVPGLFWFETRNLFLTAERRGRLRAGEALLSMQQLRALPLREEPVDQDAFVLSLAQRRSLSGYDASYLALALAQTLPLATTDQKLAAAARAEEVPVLGPLASS